MTTQWVSGVSHDMLRTVFRDHFGVQDNHADLLVVLFRAEGAYRSPKALAGMISSHRPPNVRVVWSRICGLRQAMESESIDRDQSGAFALTEVGLEECQRALRDAAVALVARDPVLVVPAEDPAPNPRPAKQVGGRRRMRA